MKKILSVLLAVLIMGIATVTAFAESTNDDSNNEETYSSLDEIKIEISGNLFKYDEYFFKYTLLFSMDIPSWSSKSKNNLKTTMEYVDSLYYNCQTVEEAVKLKEQVDKAVEDMCVSPGELRWMIEYLKKDYESEGYYDKVTTAKIKENYEQAQSAYASGDEKQIHISYISLRNLLNELCLYNQIPGDANNDGKLTIDDVTLMQKNLAGLTNFNSSQNYLTYITPNNIDIVTSWQKEIVGIADYYLTGTLNKEFDKLNSMDIIDSNIRYEEFNYHTENDNYMYYYDRYNCGINY